MDNPRRAGMMRGMFAADLHVLPNGRLMVTADVVRSVGLPLKVAKAFEKSSVDGLLALATEAVGDDPLPPSLGYWRAFTREFLTVFCQHSTASGEALPEPRDFDQRALAVPPGPGAEYVSAWLLSEHWRGLVAHVAAHGDEMDQWLRRVHPLWRMVGRVTFHLAENKRNTDYPFAFLATYTHKVSDSGQLQYLPLGKALKQYAGEKNAVALKSLMAPVRAAAAQSEYARQLLESKKVFSALAWKPAQALRFINEIDAFEQAGVIVKVPDWWKGKRPSKAVVQMTIGEETKSSVGTQALLSFRAGLAVDGEPISDEEWQRILESSENLVQIKGRWVEVDREKLGQMLAHWGRAEAAAASGVSFAEAMRLLAGFRDPAMVGLLDGAPEGGGDWLEVAAGGRLRDLLAAMRAPDEGKPVAAVKAELRHYQRSGFQWLQLLSSLGLGACLADDMGLGKTLQVIALLAGNRRKQQAPSLLVVPASLVGNWKAEFEKFAPTMKVFYAHPSQVDRSLLDDVVASSANCHAVVTTYSMLGRLQGFQEVVWDTLVLDEAQAIKNPRTAQTRDVKKISARAKIALTGTPVENSVADLWSLFDFLNPGLLGTASRFNEALKEQDAYAKVRTLVSPYILRRLKTDKSVISDLPDKTEMRTDCGLTKGQAALYKKSVEALKKELEDDQLEEFQRAGLVLTYLMRFKQICNHPALWTGSGNYGAKDSGKFARLAAIASEVASRGEKMLVFTQFREMTGALAEFLAGEFGRPGLVLHGGTAVKRRQQMVDQFQSDTGPPFFVISLKAGGTGLNLTAASHVVHFDRWWNPAVEDQATDRAFRIGQKRNVLVHKFVVRGTIEEKIDALIADKREIADELLGEGAEKLLTRMSDDELVELVALNIDRAVI
ncbi:DEAD/DEAH box helicase [Sulfuriroseicoccus oceanibius]|uniref:DEAD/DEAH box helicase n=1 Tax=Sulfuriroseicoccus oceanibius TaxID=2707525 RepID=A0A7T7F260_9BACT|nr:DEAD/DEAH box helicase [Sulfuriroseicoccus oceanibius]QQL45411.1 DEAD/DEAH box helicase [Sulfuriroseicoccus oceanibius]